MTIFRNHLHFTHSPLPTPRPRTLLHNRTSRDMDICIRCGKSGRYRCSGCNSVSYCGAQCQKEHWKRGHKGQCKALQTGQSSSILSLSGEGSENTSLIAKDELLVPNVPSARWLCSPKRVALLADVPPAQMSKVVSFSSVGIENLGNTCFINSVLQCLAYSPPLALYLQSKEHRPSCEARAQQKFCALCAMEDWVDLLLKTSSDYFVRPVDIINNLRILGPFQRGQQDDANDFLYALMEHMQKGLIGSGKITIDEENTSLLHQLFGGYKCHQMQCQSCNVVTPLKNFEYFLTLTLPLVGKLSSLEQMMLDFFRSQPVEGWKCGKCGSVDSGMENSCLYRTHPLMVLQLMRFDERSAKINVPVAFRGEMSVRPFLHPSVVEKVATDYDLYGVVVHFGNHLSLGHYVAFVRDRDRWFLCDDRNITEVSPGVVFGQMAYLLFYQRRRPGDPSPYANMAFDATARKMSAPTIHYRMDSAGESMRDLVFLVGPFEGSSTPSLKCVVDGNAGKVYIEADGTLFSWTLPFHFSSSDAKCQYYVDSRKATLVVPIESGTGQAAAAIVCQPVSGPVQEIVDADQLLDVAPDGAEAEVETQQQQSFSNDWNSEASYQNLYKEIGLKPVVAAQRLAPSLSLSSAVSQASAGAASASKDPKLKRNANCFCGSGKKYKKCHGK